MLNNLDIIKSLKGSGDYLFDLAEIVNFSDAAIDFDISRLYERELGEGIGSCLNEVMYYGVGTIEAVEGGKISMIKASSEVFKLHHLECSVSMVTSPEYEPRRGDLICWKGFQNDDGKWVAAESVIFSAART